MTENRRRMSADSPVSLQSCSEKEQTAERWRPNFHRRSKPCTNIAAVCPLPRNSQAEICENRLQSPALSSSAPNPSREDFSPIISRSSQMMVYTRQCPFSFDERDSVRRSARERRLEELRQTEDVLLESGSRFRANPVRKYKPLVLRQSSRPLTIPQTPFSHHEK
ncbi:siaz-interacting nuclear protein [Trichomycterus rosablanca]|uniref:siaz-interacting nuclear protein n=1 Tax=Trichomycterus rosablanca TaxID=2290929 RepID=UPI002F35E3B0